uniref:tripartite motif-containing protein 16 n=1 Tax=Oncorhynchus gorbuscha TaxID=8017 RepID=UPI001EAF8C01|nr:tripartite motif-containing protein 16 [Oncorhynchus gorbuscha]
MGQSLPTPDCEPSVCPLCHGICRNPTALRCKHVFCYCCIQELWSGSPTGPYYCPECKEEYKTLPVGFKRDTTASPWRHDAPAHTRTTAATGRGNEEDVIEINSAGWNLGKRAFISQSKRLLGKRPASSPVPGGHLHDNKRQATGSSSSSHSRGQSGDRKRPATSSSSSSANQNTSSDVELSSEEEVPAAPFSLATKPSSTASVAVSGPDLTRDRSRSPRRDPPIELDEPPAATEPLTREPLNDPRKSPEAAAGHMTNTSPRRITTVELDPPPPPARDPYTPAKNPAETTQTTHLRLVTPTKEKPVEAEREPLPEISNRSGPIGTSTSPTRAANNLSPGRTNLSPSLARQTSRETFLPCHYCPSQGSLPAVKTCLVCGASMCSEHLRPHLESPVFQSHTLVPPVEDTSPWRCPEHQEMNRIYCRQCSVCVCTVCTVIGSHRDHACVSIREAERELRGNLKQEMKKMQGTEESLISRVTEMTEKKRRFQVLLGDARAGVQQQYETMREALQQEEDTALLCVTREESRAVGGLEEQLTQLQETLSSLQRGLHTLEGLADTRGAARVQEQSFITEYSKITKSVSESCSVEELEVPQEVDRARLRCLQQWTERRLVSVVISLPDRDPFRLLYGASLRLDPDTAHPKLLISEENRKVSYSEVQQAYPEQGARFSSFPQVLASKPLEGGRAYWEVEVEEDEGKWKVGVCEGQIGRKGQKDSCRIGFNPYSWCLLSDKGKIEALHDKVAVPVEVDGLGRVGVLLDFEEGSLSFYKVAQGGALSLLHCFKQRFREPLYPALAVSKTQLNITDLFQAEQESE